MLIAGDATRIVRDRNVQTEREGGKERRRESTKSCLLYQSLERV